MTPKQCREKLTNRKQDYRKIKDHNSHSGAYRKTLRWYDDIDAIITIYHNCLNGFINDLFILEIMLLMSCLFCLRY